MNFFAVELRGATGRSRLFRGGGLILMTGRAIWAGLLLAGSISAAAAAPVPVLTDENLAQWRDAIRPTAAETRWQEIPWRPALWEGVVEAQKQERPILMWAMNGHPLACT
jgi:hypothetical protein